MLTRIEGDATAAAVISGRARTIEYGDYLDKVHGGWIGKAIGGTIGARFEEKKHWIEVERD
jgi:hypothetical protein